MASGRVIGWKRGLVASLRHGGGLTRAMALLLFCAVNVMAVDGPKPIRLRSTVVDTSRPDVSSGGLQAKSIDIPISGLFLIQLKGPYQADWGNQLRDLNVRLLRAIPEDAFVAELRGVRLSWVRALPFVNWVGEYRADYKVHSRLRVPFDRTSVIPVTVLLAATAADKEAAAARQFLQNLRSESASRFGVVLSGKATGGQLAQLAQSPAVLWIEPAGEPRLYDEMATRIVGGGGGSDRSAGGGPGPAPLGQPQLLTGAGVTVAVADSGLDTGKAELMHPDVAGRVQAFFAYGSLVDAADRHSHGTHIAGIIAGNGSTGETDANGFLYGLGVAPKSRLVIQRIFNHEGHFEGPISFGTVARDAVRAGAVIGSNSWGEDTHGRYDVRAMEFDALIRDADAEQLGDQPYLIVCAAGNAGPGRQTIGSPAVAKNVISTGASQNDRRDFLLYTEGRDAMADFSSRGPCEDGRIKPDLVAPGTWIASLQSSMAGNQNAWLPISSRYFYLGGTSQSAPQVAGAAALFVEHYRRTQGNTAPSPALIKAALINAATDMDNNLGTAPAPNSDEGWGRVNAAEFVSDSRTFDFLDQGSALATSEQIERRLLVATDRQPLKVTMAYTDVPGLPAAIPALVNDLDLELVAPDGRVYRGNQFQNGESIPGVVDGDRINNVEAIYLRRPIPGEYLVRVRAVNVMEDARKETPAVDQDFAMVISGDLPRSGAGILLMDRASYKAPGNIQLKLIDFDLAGQSSAEVRVRSFTERAGERVVLRPAGTMGVFTGMVATALSTGSGPGGPPLPTVPVPGATNPPVSPGVLELQHGDVIEAVYEDAAPSATRQATALADFEPPIVTQVTSTNRFGKTFITWTTSEPATSIVAFGPSPTNLVTVTDSTFVVQHEMALEQLRTGTRYFFTVGSADQAGNLSAATNVYSFIGKSAATVLVVNAYETDAATPEIPVTAYTDTLQQIGLSYELWDLAKSGSPTLADLKPFRVVMWRISDSIFVKSSLTSDQQATIDQYIRNGGSFFMASMEILSRLGAVPFRTNVLQVAKFDAGSDLFSPCEDCDQDAGVPQVSGAEFDPLMSGISVVLDYSKFSSITELDLGPDFSDTFTATSDAVPILVKTGAGRTAGIRYPRQVDDRNGRVVFLSFPLEAVPADGSDPNNRAGILRNLMAFLAPGADGVGSIATDRTVYTVPGRVTLEVADSDLVGRGELSVRAFTSSTRTGHSVRLTETIRPGLFRGAVTLVSTNRALASGQLQAKEGDSVWAEYRDESARTTVRAVAKIDLSAPLVNQVAVSPQYEDAVVSWKSSEATDALVQFGESVFLGRTSYRASLGNEHALSLTGLKPNRLYYFQVVSRDAAGNAVVDDNGGKLYTFRTLKPFSAPWSDDLEKGESSWTVLNGVIGTANWALGTPVTGSKPRSGTKAWASNLSGSAIEFADTRLVSPPIELVSGNQATLRFWHHYDFTGSSVGQFYEYGRVLISTDNGATWKFLREYTGASSGWKQVEIDLTAYLGRVIRLSWHYNLFALDRKPRPGWLIDDVSVQTENLVRGTIRVTSSLSQARFRIDGPISQTGAGSEFSVPNAPAGRYVVRFEEVPFYITPAPQTNLVETSGAIRFHGQYTFPDVNQNQISDLWEERFFGPIITARTARRDADGDGASDYAEFMAGTDPTNSSSKLEFTRIERLPNRLVRVTWPAVPGYAYRVQANRGNALWAPVSDWQRAATAESSWSSTIPFSDGALLLKLEVRP